VGIHNVYFRENANLYEFDAKNNIPYFNEFNFNTYLKTTGNGYNLKLGIIFKPTDNLRLGAAIHSPTFYKFSDAYNSSMTSSITYLSDGVTETYSAKPDKQGVYDYEIETPLKAIFSGAYVIGKSGLISVDYEIVDYSTAKLKNGSDGYNYYNENTTIQNAYKTVGNLHLGGEYRVNKIFSIRAGYENFPSVYQASYLNSKNMNSNTSYSTISGGFGFKQGNFFLDATLKRIMNDEYLKLYPGATNMAKYVTAQDNLIFTLGYKF
jgi:long-subunit fatty acid transport protein